MPTEDPFNSPHNQASLIDSFAKATWLTLGFAFVCLALDVYAMLFLPHHRSRLLGVLHSDERSFPLMVWGMEIALALLALWLIRFAFSKGPRLKPDRQATKQTR